MTLRRNAILYTFVDIPRAKELSTSNLRIKPDSNYIIYHVKYSRLITYSFQNRDIMVIKRMRNYLKYVKKLKL